MAARRRPEPYVWDGDITRLADRLGIKDVAYLERLINKEEAAPASLARKVATLTAGRVELEVRKPGRPPAKLEHPLAQWIDANRSGDKQAFAEEIGISIEHLRDVLNYRGDLGTKKARKIRELTGLSWEDLLGE
jgi:hypothetical protein